MTSRERIWGIMEGLKATHTPVMQRCIVLVSTHSKDYVAPQGRPADCLRDASAILKTALR
jgi:hypothetical protein